MADNPTTPTAGLLPPRVQAGSNEDANRARHQTRPRNGRALDLAGALDDAECLLHYAAQVGIIVPDDVMSPILAAREAVNRGPLQSSALLAFLSAYATLAKQVAPVTAETVRESNDLITGTAVRLRGWLALTTTVLVVSMSVLLFITTSIGDNITKGITKTNEMAATVRGHVGAPAIGNTADEKCGEATALPKPDIKLPPTMTDLDMITELQQFAASIRDLQTQAIKLNYLVKEHEHDRIDLPRPEDRSLFPWTTPEEALQLPPSLSNFRAAALCKIAVYEEVRNFAQNVNSDATLVYGSLGQYVLPVLFALLGSFAYNLRDYTNRVRTRTYHRSYLETARIIVAVIAGAILSYFTAFTQGLSLLAAAFLVGYGVEIFFAFLDSLLVSFGAKRPVAAPGGGTNQG